MAEFFEAGFLQFIVGLLIYALCIHWVAGIVLGSSRFSQALVVAIVGGLLAFVVAIGAESLDWPRAVGIVLALVAWALVASALYRTQWAKGAIVGVAAWVTWAFVGLIINLIAGN